jgi:hypothetical protein
VTARGHLVDMVSAFRALADLGAVNVGIVPVPSLDPDHLHVSLDVGSAETLRRVARELGASEPEVYGCDGKTWLGSDLRLGSITVRITSEYLRTADHPAAKLALYAATDAQAVRS